MHWYGSRGKMYKTVQINCFRKVFCVTAYPCVSTSVPLTYEWAFGFVGAFCLTVLLPVLALHWIAWRSCGLQARTWHPRFLFAAWDVFWRPLGSGSIALRHLFRDVQHLQRISESYENYKTSSTISTHVKKNEINWNVERTSLRVRWCSHARFRLG